MHGLHKTIDVPPLIIQHKYKWQKDHEQNMTGTEKLIIQIHIRLSNS